MTHANITNDLLHDLIAEPLSVVELCARHGLSIEQLHEIIISPAFRRLSAMIHTIQRARDAFRLARITETLERIALEEPTTPAHTETIRKAAAHLDRQLRKDAAGDADSQPTPEPATEPTPEPATESPSNPDAPTHHDPQAAPRPQSPPAPAAQAAAEPPAPDQPNPPEHQPRAA